MAAKRRRLTSFFRSPAMSLLRTIALSLALGCAACVLVAFCRVGWLPAAQRFPEALHQVRRLPAASVPTHAAVAANESANKSAELASGPVVAVIIPFRDREHHLAMFKKYWRWFASEGQRGSALARLRWEIYIVEQFDAEAFNRGWNFNAGLAIATAHSSASPEIAPSMDIGLACAAIQDIDYLPEAGVDYANCSVPTQLSAEIDRYDWKTPYLRSAGGIVAMSAAHWRKINGFGNDYFGWGGEDDELFHRLRLNDLLFGDCYPFCGDGDKDIGRLGLSIRRPVKGRGRFSGKYMHSANHTKRVTDAKLYQANLGMVHEIESNGTRWKSDGLSNLAFRILSNHIDTADLGSHGITYHHVRVRRGNDAFDLSQLNLAYPGGCSEGSPRADWSLEPLGPSVPWDLGSFRAHVARKCKNVDMASQSRGSFILVDRRRCLAKILDEEDPRLLVSFYRSLRSPPKDGLIVFDLRPRPQLLEAFAAAEAFDIPAAQHTVCTSSWYDTIKYSIHQGSVCSANGWDPLKGGTIHGYAQNRTGLKAVSFCDNEQHWTQRFVLGGSCPPQWAGLEWKHGGTFWVSDGDDFCVGSRHDAKGQEMRFSRLLARKDCGGDGFVHDFSFKSVGDADSLAKLQGKEMEPSVARCARHDQGAIARSTPRAADKRSGIEAYGPPLYRLVQEQVPCFSFICPSANDVAVQA